MTRTGTRARQMASLLAGSPHALHRFARRQLGRYSPPELYYVVPGADWAVDRVGQHVTSGMRTHFGWRAHLTSTPHLLVDHILHYGELWSFLASLGAYRNTANTVVTTVFHADRRTAFPELARAAETLLAHAHAAARIVTVCRIMEERLRQWGVPPGKVVRIPLGVDLAHFQPADRDHAHALRRRLAIPDDAVCIGSFQKDGQGWDAGFAPKLQKGPDVLLEVVRRLSARCRVFVLLTGPARGYVTAGLERMGVAYRHDVVHDHRSLPAYYHCLDVYLVTAREEGGPNGVLEALACGVPLVSTRVGMAPDVVRHGWNGCLAEPEDVETLVDLVSRVAEAPAFRGTLTENGLHAVVPYDWPSIVARYHDELYRPLLAALPHRVRT